ncbi:MAG: hypothetical protein RIB60_05990 [Phycisphaerales bacterium]
MLTERRNEQGSFDLKQPGRTPEEELWKALEWMRRSGFGSLIHAYREAGYVYGALGRPPIPIEYPERRDELRLQHEAFERGEPIRGKLGDPAWTGAIELFRGAYALYRPLVERARAALPAVSRSMDDPALPRSHWFTSRVSRLIDRLDDALPGWYRHPSQHPGDEYVQRFAGFPDPTGLIDLLPELDDVLDLLRGVWRVDRDPVVIDRPPAIKRVFELVRSNPEAFEEVIQSLESAYSAAFIEEARLETLAHERDLGLLKRFNDRDVDLKQLERWKPSEARPVLPSHLLNSMDHEDMAPLVPLRLALYHAKTEKWRAGSQIRKSRVRTARRYAVLTCLALDPDVAEYLGSISTWACLAWPDDEFDVDPLTWGRSIMEIGDLAAMDEWAERCARVLEELMPSHEAATSQVVVADVSAAPVKTADGTEWTQEKVDDLVRQHIQRSRQGGQYNKWKRMVEQGDREGSRLAQQKIGQNVLQRTIGCSLYRIRKSLPFVAAQKELRMGKEDWEGVLSRDEQIARLEAEQQTDERLDRVYGDIPLDEREGESPFDPMNPNPD